MLLCIFHLKAIPHWFDRNSSKPLKHQQKQTQLSDNVLDVDLFYASVNLLNPSKDTVQIGIVFKTHYSIHLTMQSHKENKPA